jgi:hypothetical protein
MISLVVEKDEFVAEPLTLQISATAVGSAAQSATDIMYSLCCRPLAYMIELSSSQVRVNRLIIGKLKNGWMKFVFLQKVATF